MTFRQALNLIYKFDIDTQLEESEKIFKFKSCAYNNYLLEVSISLNRMDLFEVCLKNTTDIFGTSLRCCISNNRLEMLKLILRKRCKEFPITVPEYLQRLYYSNPSFETVRNIQECCWIISNMNIVCPMYKEFISTHSNLRERQRKRTLKELYYAIIERVICNPKHPIGLRLITKEYNELLG
jgi:hypothetical protein